MLDVKRVEIEIDRTNATNIERIATETETEIGTEIEKGIETGTDKMTIEIDDKMENVFRKKL